MPFIIGLVILFVGLYVLDSFIKSINNISNAVEKITKKKEQKKLKETEKIEEEGIKEKKDKEENLKEWGKNFSI